MKCPKCGDTQKYSDGRCAKCRRAKSALWRKKNPELNQSRKVRYERLFKGWLPGEHEKAEAARTFVTECACCLSKSPRNKKGWCADHDAKTGLFRAYLCHPCNIILGFVEKYAMLMSDPMSRYIWRFK
jgi:hypothetical protein